MKKIFSLTLLLTFCALSASAEVDKFVSSTKYNVKTNPLAQMMENATKKSMQNNQTTSQSTKNYQNKQQNYNKNYNNYNKQYNTQQNNVKKTSSGWT